MREYPTLHLYTNDKQRKEPRCQMTIAIQQWNDFNIVLYMLLLLTIVRQCQSKYRLSDIEYPCGKLY